MAKRDDERKSKLEKTQESLYDKYTDIHPKKRAGLHKHTTSGPEEWESISKEPVMKSKKNSRAKMILGWAKKLFVGALAFFIIALGFVGIRLWQGGSGVSSDAVDISIFTQNFVDGGESFDVVVRVTNNNSAPLELADLVIEYPKTSIEGGDIVRERIAINTIDAGEAVERDFKVELFGQEGEQRPITAKLEYRVAGSNAIFVAQDTQEVGIQSTPITLTVDGPERTVANQEITFSIQVESNVGAVTEDVLVNVEYPRGFTFSSASPNPSFQGNSWALGDMAPGSSREIEITGVLSGEVATDNTFTFMMGTERQDREGVMDTLFNSMARVVRIAPAFIQASINVEGDTGSVVSVPSASDFDVDISWTNTLPVAIQNAKVIVTLSGSAYNPASVVADDGGFFDSNTDTVVWDATNTQTLQSVEPGEQGQFSFEMAPRALVQGGTSVLRQPSIFVNVSVEGTNVGGSVEDIQQVASTEIKVITQAQVQPRTLYYDGPFQNAGSVPPTVGEETEYTLSWRISNSSSRIEDGTIVTRLPSYVEWKSQTSPGSENIEYNSSTRELIWDIGTVEAGTGFSDPSREVFFKVGIIPSTSQQGSAPALTESLVFTGVDTYTDETVRIVRNAHTTRLLNDISVESGKVQ